MTEIDITRIDHEKLSQEVRIRLAARLERLLNAMEVLLEDDPRDFSASQLSVYLQTVRLLGDLYQVRERPRVEGDLVPLEKVQRMVEAAVEEARIEAVAQERDRVALERVHALESAGTAVRDRLRALRDRATSSV